MDVKELAVGTERVWALIFEAGDEAMSGLTTFARDAGLAGARFQAVGAFASVTVGWFDVARQDYERVSFDEQLEVLSLLGDVALEDGRPRVHAHVVLGDRDARAHGGHLLEGVVLPTLEVILTESPAHLQKRFRAEFGLALIDSTI
jgi:predicted DNA-binding protein with PD1-like motif